jgi:hypothetical protein
MSEEKAPKIEILDKYESDIGVYVVIRTDYGLKTQLNFSKPVSDEEIERQLRRFYEEHQPERQPQLEMKKGKKIDW